jgi:hypothetical protein
MTDRELLVQQMAQLDNMSAAIRAQLSGTPFTPTTPTTPTVPVVPPVNVPPAGDDLWQRGRFARMTFAGPGDAHAAYYIVPQGASYPPGQVQIYGDNAFMQGYLDVNVDGIPVVMGDPIPVTPGRHVITAVANDRSPRDAFANIQVTNQ